MRLTRGVPALIAHQNLTARRGAGPTPPSARHNHAGSASADGRQAGPGRRGAGPQRPAPGRAGRPLPYGADGVERQPEGVVAAPAEHLAEAQALLDAGMPFHAHEVFEDAWKSGPEAERALWRGLAQLAVGLTHAARGNVSGGARLLLRGAAGLAAYGETGPHGIDITGLTTWAHRLADGLAGPVDAKASAPQLTGG